MCEDDQLWDNCKREFDKLSIQVLIFLPAFQSFAPKTAALIVVSQY